MKQRQIIRLDIEVEVEDAQDASWQRDHLCELVRAYGPVGTLSVTSEVLADSAHGAVEVPS